MVDDVHPSFLTADEWQRIMNALRLSRREREIMHGFFVERSDHEIALALGMKIATVREHIERLYRKLDTHTRSGAILRVFAVHAAVLCGDDSNAADSSRDDLLPQPAPVNLPAQAD